MNLASLSIAGVDLAKTHTTSHASVTRFADVDDVRVKRRAPARDQHPQAPDPSVGEAKWPAWKVTVFVMLFCGAFWGGVIWLGMRLLG